MSCKVCLAPSGIVAVDLGGPKTSGLSFLHGKFEPSARRGELLRESGPYGGGFTIFIWADDEEISSAAATRRFFVRNMLKDMSAFGFLDFVPDEMVEEIVMCV